MISSRRPPTFMPGYALAEAGDESAKGKRRWFFACKGVSNCLPVAYTTPTSLTVTVSPALASAPVPTTSSFVSSFAGAGPEGGVTFGSFDSGPLVGVLAGVVGGGVEAVAFSPEWISELSALFSLPTVIVLEPPEPQPAIRAAAQRAPAARTVRRMVGGRY